MGTKCILRGNEMHFVGSKSLYFSLCPPPGLRRYQMFEGNIPLGLNFRDKN